MLIGQFVPLVPSQSHITPADYFARVLQTLPPEHRATLVCLLEMFDALVQSEDCDLGYEDIGMVLYVINNYQPNVHAYLTNSCGKNQVGPFYAPV